MQKIVLDCSVVVKWFSAENEELQEQAKKLLFSLYNNKIEVFAPELLFYELINVLLKSKRLKAKQIQESIEKLRLLDFNIMNLSKVLERTTIEIADKYELTAYDAAYLALARLEKATLFTCDKDLINTRAREVRHLSTYGLS